MNYCENNYKKLQKIIFGKFKKRIKNKKMALFMRIVRACMNNGQIAESATKLLSFYILVRRQTDGPLQGFRNE